MTEKREASLDQDKYPMNQMLMEMEISASFGSSVDIRVFCPICGQLDPHTYTVDDLINDDMEPSCCQQPEDERVVLKFSHMRISLGTYKSPS